MRAHLSYFCLLASGLLASSHTSLPHSKKQRVYILCSTKSGELYQYKNSDLHDPNTNCVRDVARAKFENNINETGWGILDVEVADENITDYEQGYAMGFVEGRATRDLIKMHIKNTADGYCKGVEEYCERLAHFFLQNLIFMRKEIERKPKDSYWRHVNVSLNQVLGMINGFEDDLNGHLDDSAIVIHPLYQLQIPWELEELEMKLKRPRRARDTLKGNGHCSALVKVTDDNSDLLFSHITWDTYSSMLRLQKRYRFKLPHAPGSTYTFSGYPGSINSIDDFILTSAKLAILETTMNLYNEDLLKFITPQTVLTWARTQVATRLASDAAQWVKMVSRYNSGTYNNQWVVVDYKRFRPGKKELSGGLIHIVELLPGIRHQADMSKYLEKHRFWPSYNRPYFPDVNEKSGTAEMARKHGDYYTYDKTARALIFSRDQHLVKDVDSMRKMMRYNDFMKDPLSRCDCNPPYSAACTIASRSDLNPPNGTFPFEDLAFKDMGATDVKITNVEMMKTLSFDAVAGPTHDPLPVFKWSTSLLRFNVSHVGHPDEFNFAPVRHRWLQNSLYNQ